MTETVEPEEKDQARSLLREMRTVHLATVAVDGTPQASYAPFVIHEQVLWVYLSALASHVGNLRASGRAGVMLIRDEGDCDEPFARPRLSASCRVTEEPRDSERWNRVMDAFESRFGDVAATVRGLGDFALFRLEPLEGRVVAGFARARRLAPAAVAALMAEVGDGRHPS